MIARLTHAFRWRLRAMRHSRPFRPLARAAHAFRRELAWHAARLTQALSASAYTVVFEYPDVPLMPVQVYHVSARSLGAAVRQAERCEDWLSRRAGWLGDRRPACVVTASEGWTHPEDLPHEYDDAPW